MVDGAADDESADELSEQEESLIEEETTPGSAGSHPGGGTADPGRERTAACSGRRVRSGHAEHARLSGDRRDGGRRR